MRDFGDNNKTAVQAKFDAQKIAFGPVMFQAARALRDLGILKCLNESTAGLSVEEVADKTNVSVYGAKVLLEAGLSMEMVYLQNNAFFLSKTGWFLLHDPLTTVNLDFVHDVNYEGFFKLKESVQSGSPEGLKVFGSWKTIYEGLSQLPEEAKKSWFAFDHFYSDAAFPVVLPLLFENSPKKILDVGGNTGKFSIACAKHHPEVEVTILDLAGQLAKAKENVQAAGFQDRIHFHQTELLPNDADFPTGFDMVWMSQFLDCLSKESIVAVLKKAAQALNKTGSIYILETLWDQQKYPASMYSLHATSLYFTCLANGCSQMYSLEDFEHMLDAAGLKIETITNDIGLGHTLLQCTVK